MAALLWYVADVPAAAGALFVRNGVGWLRVGSTLPNYRGKGLQQRLIANRIADAVQLGCRILVTETAEDLPERSSPSYRNMIRAGFKPVWRRANYDLEF